jgi:glycosyltransferase involved in cell wall biosynthesis
MNRVVMLSIADFNYFPPAFNEGLVLAQTGYQVDVFTLKNKGESEKEEIIDNYLIHRIHLWTRFLPKTHFFWTLKYLEFITRFFLAEAPHKASIYVAHNFDALIPIYIIATLKKSKILYRAHELYTETFDLPLAFIWRWIERKLLNHIDATITPNEERAEIMYLEYGARVKPFVVMNCPRYTLPITSTLLQDYLREWGILNQFILLLQGRLCAENGVEELITAAQYIDDGISLILLGPITPEYSRLLKSKIEQLGLRNKVLIHEPVSYDNLPKYTASADLGVVLYRNKNRNYYYCAPNKLFEYFMMGLPVVSSNFPGLIKLVEGNDCGKVVNPSSPVEISDAVNYIYRNPQKAQEMRENSLKKAQIYNWENESKKLLFVYKELLR